MEWIRTRSWLVTEGFGVRIGLTAYRQLRLVLIDMKRAEVASLGFTWNTSVFCEEQEVDMANARGLMTGSDDRERLVCGRINKIEVDFSRAPGSCVHQKVNQLGLPVDLPPLSWKLLP
jgi:hypothetical protein